MTGTVWDYNDRYIRIMSGELRKIIFFKSNEEYQECLEKGMKINKQVVFDNDTDEIIKFF